MKIVVAGSRDFNDYELLCSVLDECRESVNCDIEIVCGGARGADKLGEIYADNNGLIKHPFPADWNKYGKSAGYKRNEDMARFSDAVICFWDEKSKGTKHMIDLAKKYKLKLKVIRYEAK